MVSELYIFKEYYNGEMNFMTPQAYAYTTVQFDDENLVLFEKSRNKERTLYGASALHYNPVTEECQKIDLSECFGSSKEVNDYIKGLKRDDFDKADKYGVVKKI